MTANKHRDDPVLILARRMHGESAGWAWFGNHAPEDPTHAADGWEEPYGPTIANPAWPGDVLRVAWQAPLLLPDEDAEYDEHGNVRTHPVGVLSATAINATRGTWLRFKSRGNVDIRFTASMPLSRFCELIAELGGDVYVPIIGVGNADWSRWDSVRKACLKAGRFAEVDK